MAERKYDLALHNTITSKPVKKQGWFKERLETKHKKLNPWEERHKISKCIDWHFVEDGSVGYTYIRNDHPRFKDGINSGKSHPGTNTTKPKAPRRLDKTCYLSRRTQRQQQRIDYVNELEKNILTQPMALYPHLESSLAPERKPMVQRRLQKLGEPKLPRKVAVRLFEDIVDLLDPQFDIQDMRDTERALEINTGGWKLGKDSVSGTSLTFTRGNDNRGTAEDSGPAVAFRESADAGFGNPKNPYRYLPAIDTSKDGKKAKENDKQQWPASSAEEDEHISKVTQEFCDWVRSLEGELDNIEESTITSLFASGYETKPAFSVPIHVVDLAKVPQELKQTATVPPPNAATTGSSSVSEYSDGNGNTGGQKLKAETKPAGANKWHFKYGAWYLPPRTWKKMDKDEPLLDPKMIKDEEMSEARQKNTDLNLELSTMHVAKAFSDYIGKKNYRKPGFLEDMNGGNVSPTSRITVHESRSRQR